MSIARWWEVGGGRGGDANDKFVRNYTRKFKAITDNALDDSEIVMAYSRCPQIWSAHPSNSMALCLSVNADNTADDGDARHWEVSAKYSTSYGTQNQQSPNPLEDRVKRSIRFNSCKRIITEDINGVPCVNVAGDAPSEPVEIDAVRPTFVFQRNEELINVDRVIAYCYAINNNDFLGCPRRTLRSLISVGEEQTRNGTSFWPVTYEFEYRPETWRISYLSQGYNLLVGTAGNLLKVKVPGGSPRLIAPTNRASNPDGKPGPCAFKTGSENDPPFFCKRDGYHERNFNDLGLI